MVCGFQTTSKKQINFFTVLGNTYTYFSVIPRTVKKLICFLEVVWKA